MREFDAGRFHQTLHVEVWVASHADRGEVDLAGLFLRRGDQLGDRVGREARARHQDVRNLDQLCDADEVARWLDLQLMRVDGLVDGVGRHVADEQRVAVGRRFGGGLEREVAVRARPVLDEKRLSERFGEALRDDARDDVGGATGAVGHQDSHRLARVGVLRHRRRDAEHAKQQCAYAHRYPPRVGS